MRATAEPFELRIGDATLTDHGMTGSLQQDGIASEWDLSWEPRLEAYGHVHPFLRRAKIAKTVLFLPHPGVGVRGFVQIGDRRIDVAGAEGGQAHLWGSKHATRWAWAHCNDFTGPDGRPRDDTFIDGVSVYVPRFGRQIGPNTPVVARIGGHDLLSVGPLAVTRNPSEFGLDHWRFEARDGRRKATCEVSARREDLVGVTYHDPDGELAYCYNTEVADMRLNLWERDGRRAPWRKVDELRSERHAHFEYAQRTPRRRRAAAREVTLPFEWSDEGGLAWLECSLPDARAVFSTRKGGVSAGPYESLNLGILTDDDPSLVARNGDAR